MIGMGADSARGTFDNIAVLVVPPATTFQNTEDFSDGIANLFPMDTRTGAWSVTGGRYVGTPASGGIATSLIDLGISGLQLNSLLDLSTVVNTQTRAGFVFDRYSADDYKFALIDAPADKIIIGHYTKSGVVNDAVLTQTIDAGVNYTLGVTLKGSTVSVTLNGAVVLGKTYNAVVVDGEFGLLAAGGAASFDDIKVKTNDPAFAQQAGSNMLADDVGGGAAQSGITQAELDAVTASAAQYWTATLGNGDERLAALAGFRITTANLAGDALGYAEGRTVFIDDDAAGNGWALPGAIDSGRMDLATVVTHEVGHMLGFRDNEPGLAAMHGDLEAGETLVAEARVTAPEQVPARTLAAFDFGAAPSTLGLDAGLPVIDWKVNAAQNWSGAYAAFSADGAASFGANYSDYLVRMAAPSDYDGLGSALLNKGKKSARSAG